MKKLREGRFCKNNNPAYNEFDYNEHQATTNRHMRHILLRDFRKFIKFGCFFSNFYLFILFLMKMLLFTFFYF